MIPSCCCCHQRPCLLEDIGCASREAAVCSVIAFMVASSCCRHSFNAHLLLPHFYLYRRRATSWWSSTASTSRYLTHSVYFFPAIFPFIALQEARNFLVEQYREHEPSRESIELALDSILQVRLCSLLPMPRGHVEEGTAGTKPVVLRRCTSVSF